MEIHTAFFAKSGVLDYEDVVEWRVVDPNNEIKTGDLLLYSASGILSSIIKGFTFSKWNHIGIVCWCNLKMKNGSEKVELFCYEMGSQPYEDLITREIVDRGVRLVALANIAEMYDVISIRKIRRGNNWKLERFVEFMHQWKGMPFPGVLSLLKAYALRPGYSKGQVTCAQLAALMLHHMNVIDLKFDSSQLTPGHYTSDSRAFPRSIFKGKESVIYRDSTWLRKRQYFIFAIVVILIITVLVLHKKKHRKG
jgi:hypothetical protein